MNISSIKPVFEAISSFNDCVTLFEWVKSLWSGWNGAENELKEDDVRQFEGSLRRLRDTLPVMCDFINRAEWRSHQKCVAELLPELKDAVYDAEDLVEDFKCYEQMVGNATSAEAGKKSFHNFIQRNFDKLTHIHKRLENQQILLKGMGLHKATPRFDRSVRPETTRYPNEAMIGRDDEVKELLSLLGVPESNRRGPPRHKRKRSAICSSANEATITSVPVLPIVGIGGVGKTTLIQNICSHPQVKEHFDVIAWICVSDDFDVKRLTKGVIEKISGNTPTIDNLSSLQDYLIDRINKRRLLFVLDDVWVEDAELWKRFYAPFKHVLEGSMMLVTTRSQKVADIVRTTVPFLLEGLKDDVFLNFFKLCVFGSISSNSNLELERIGEQILPKLKGSPLAVKTIGRLLGRSLDPAHWNMILNSELWEHKQKGTDIMPALRLSYIYLPFHLKRCFSFCAVYPKDCNFIKEHLAEIWAAEGFVEAEHNVPLQQTACEYFEELAHLSFFQELNGEYVMHDLIHDMAQLVSKDECFIIKDKKDLERIPQNVRHLSVLESSDFKCSDLGSLCKHTKLRTLLCNMSLKGQDGVTVMKNCCAELLCMRVMVMDCNFFSETVTNGISNKKNLPDSISNMKNLRYLKFSGFFSFDRLPATFCQLYNLQLFSAWVCSFEEIPRHFSKLTNLRKFESQSLKIDAAMENGEGIRLLNNSNLVTRYLSICNLCEISKDEAAEIELTKKDCIFNLRLVWPKQILDLPGPPKHNEIEVFEALHPPTNIKSVGIWGYPGEYLPSWFRGSDSAMLSSLTGIYIENCPRLSSLELFLQPAYMPAIKTMLIKDCSSLESVPAERFDNFPSLEELEVWNCPKMKSQRLLVLSLETLRYDGSFGDDIDCIFLTTFVLRSSYLASLTFIRESEAISTSASHVSVEEKFPLLTDLTIEKCFQLETLHHGSFSCLKKLSIESCPRLKWQSEMVLPSSLQELTLGDCGDISAWFLRCLEKLTSLKSLKMDKCKHIEDIPRSLWTNNLKSLQQLSINNCEDLVSIGAPEGIAHIRKVWIAYCTKLDELQQPLRR